MSRRSERFASALRASAGTLTLALAASVQAGPPAIAGIGRAPTAAELRSWDIDVRADFKGLPPGSGSVDTGTRIWEAKCASCHGDFGESNAVFTPIVGGTTRKDIEAGRVDNLAHPGYPHRTTLMKVSKLSSLWDYIHRAMPWNAPKTLSNDDVYAVLAYILNLGDIVPADYVLSDRNIGDVQKRLPNRDGHAFDADLWLVHGKGDVRNPLCMADCPVQVGVASSLPVAARNSNGNISEQVRPFGATRGTDTSLPPARGRVGTYAVATADAAVAATSGAAAVTGSTGPASSGITADKLPPFMLPCSSCHGIANKIVGPAFRDIATKYAGRADAVDYLVGKIRAGGSGVWGPIPMPPQTQLGATDAHAIALWLAAGAK